MLRTDHIYPRTVMMPLEPLRPRDSDMGELSPLVFSPRLPPIVEPLAPSPRRTNNPPVPDHDSYLFPNPEARARARARKAVYILQGVDQQGRQATGVHVRPQPPSRVPWLGLVVSVALFAVGYLLGRWLP